MQRKAGAWRDTPRPPPIAYRRHHSLPTVTFLTFPLIPQHYGGAPSITEEAAMSGLQRLSREALRTSSFVTRRSSDLNFGLIAIVLLATLAIAFAVMLPDATLPTLEFPGVALSP